ncbi:MAG: PH domain-containing protein [Candidatus Methanomethylicia archaeon]
MIKRCLRSILIPYSVVSGVRRVSWIWRAVRFCANGGLYGFFGLFYVQGLGRVWMYVTDRGQGFSSMTY